MPRLLPESEWVEAEIYDLDSWDLPGLWRLQTTANRFGTKARKPEIQKERN